jgi:hypothetical protein
VQGFIEAPYYVQLCGTRQQNRAVCIIINVDYEEQNITLRKFRKK